MKRLSRMERKQRAAYWREYYDSLEPDYEMRKSMVAARLRAGYSQRDLALRMGISQPAIARMERGRTSPNVRTLRRMAEATGSKLVIRLEEQTEESPKPLQTARDYEPRTHEGSKERS